MLRPPVAAVSFAVKEAEGPDVASVIAEVQRKLRCKWKDFAVLYRSHAHRDDVIRELADAEIPFAIENLDVSDAPEVRDLFACLRAVSSVGDDISLFRAAALPQFNVDPVQLREAMRSLARDGRDAKSAQENGQERKQERDRRPASLAAVLDRVPGGSAVLEVIRAARDEIKRGAPCPIASCETLHGRREFKPFFDHYATDVAIIDVIWNGLNESLKIAAMADVYEVNCAPHNFYGHLCSAISATFSAVAPNFRVMEIDIDSAPWRDEFYETVPVIEDGKFVLPKGPGWGININEKAVRARPPKT